MTDYRNDMTREAVKARERFATLGRQVGERLLVKIQQSQAVAERQEGREIDPYLMYLFYLGVAQTVENEGRRIGGIDFTKADKDLEGKKA